METFFRVTSHLCGEFIRLEATLLQAEQTPTITDVLLTALVNKRARS